MLVYKPWLRPRPLPDATAQGALDRAADRPPVRVIRPARVRGTSLAGRDRRRRLAAAAAIHHERAHSTNVYRSAATGDFCFTIAAALRDTSGHVRGVLAADGNFQQLLAR